MFVLYGVSIRFISPLCCSLLLMSVRDHEHKRLPEKGAMGIEASSLQTFCGPARHPGRPRTLGSLTSGQFQREFSENPGPDSSRRLMRVVDLRVSWPHLDGRSRTCVNVVQGGSETSPNGRKTLLARSQFCDCLVGAADLKHRNPRPQKP